MLEGPSAAKAEMPTSCEGPETETPPRLDALSLSLKGLGRGLLVLGLKAFGGLGFRVNIVVRRTRFWGVA